MSELTDRDKLERDHKLLERKLPDNLKEEIQCMLCGQKKHLLRLNDRVAFYVHRGDELKTCKSIGFKTSFAIDLGKQMYERYIRSVQKTDSATT